MSKATNPYAVTTLEIGNSRPSLNPESNAVRWWVAIAVPLMLIGSATAVINIRTIVVSGPVMFVYGLILLLLQRRGGRRYWWFAWFCFAFPIFVFLIIFFFSMSPDDAQAPIGALCCMVTAVSAVWVPITLARRKGPRDFDPSKFDPPALDPALESDDHDGSGVTLLS